MTCLIYTVVIIIRNVSVKLLSATIAILRRKVAMFCRASRTKRSTCSCKARLPSNTVCWSMVSAVKRLLIHDVVRSCNESDLVLAAIRYYRRAIQLVPDIETKIEEFQPKKPTEVVHRGITKDLSIFLLCYVYKTFMF